ncbi:MAG: Fic family protein [Caulobacter sp.]
MLLSSPIGSFVREADGWCFDPDIEALDVDVDLELYLGDLLGRLGDLSSRKPPEDLEARLARADVRARPPLSVEPSADARKKAGLRAATASERRRQQARLGAGLHRLETLAPELGALRTRRVRVLENGPKGGIACAPASAIPSRLAQLSAFIARNRSRSPALTAIYAYALFLFIHPFADENGRTARQLLAAMLRPETGGDEPLLFAPVMNLFEGELSECMHDLIFRGGWAAFTARLAAIITIYIEATIQVTTCDHVD